MRSVLITKQATAEAEVRAALADPDVAEIEVARGITLSSQIFDDFPNDQRVWTRWDSPQASDV